MTPWTASRQASLSLTISQSLLRFMSIESVRLSNHLILCRPSSCLQSFPASGYFPVESTLYIRWQVLALQHPSNDYSGLISFRIVWFDLFAVQGIFKSLLQHHNLKASILQHSAFYMVQLSHPYMTTGKIIALIIQTFVSKVMSLLFNTLSRFVKAFLPRNLVMPLKFCQQNTHQ